MWCQHCLQEVPSRPGVGSQRCIRCGAYFEEMGGRLERGPSSETLTRIAESGLDLRLAPPASPPQLELDGRLQEDVRRASQRISVMAPKGRGQADRREGTSPVAGGARTGLAAPPSWLSLPSDLNGPPVNGNANASMPTGLQGAAYFETQAVGPLAAATPPHSSVADLAMRFDLPFANAANLRPHVPFEAMSGTTMRTSQFDYVGPSRVPISPASNVVSQASNLGMQGQEIPSYAAPHEPYWGNLPRSCALPRVGGPVAAEPNVQYAWREKTGQRAVGAAAWWALPAFSLGLLTTCVGIGAIVAHFVTLAPILWPAGLSMAFGGQVIVLGVLIAVLASTHGQGKQETSPSALYQHFQTPIPHGPEQADRLNQEHWNRQFLAYPPRGQSAYSSHSHA